MEEKQWQERYDDAIDCLKETAIDYANAKVRIAALETSLAEWQMKANGWGDRVIELEAALAKAEGELAMRRKTHEDVVRAAGCNPEGLDGGAEISAVVRALRASLAEAQAETKRWNEAAFRACAGLVCTPANPSKQPCSPTILIELRELCEARGVNLEKAKATSRDLHIARHDMEVERDEMEAERDQAQADLERVRGERDEALAKLKEAEGLLRDWITPDIGTTRRLDRVTREYLASLGEGGEPDEPDNSPPAVYDRAAKYWHCSWCGQLLANLTTPPAGEEE